jgi:5-enolpyruvylshikimate-3-phosphate synthase
MESLTLQPLQSINGDVTLPGSKSLSNRILLLAAVAQGETRISNLLDSDDVRHMLNSLKALGVPYTLSADKSTCTLQGRGGALNFEGALEMFLGNAGTAMRPLCAMLCAGEGDFTIKAGQRYVSPGTMMVEGDASSASYFLAAAAIAGGTVRVHGTGSASVQGDARFAEVLEQMGAKVTWGDTWIEVSRGELHGVDVDLNHIPDAAMTIATTALFAKGPTAIRNIYNWRVKETDRLSAMATELRKVGAVVTEGEDFIEITPPLKIQPAAIDTYDDHRMAMCFSLAAFGDSAITINDPGCTSKTFPTYFELFTKLCTPR